jgi:hypothetical protein
VGQFWRALKLLPADDETMAVRAEFARRGTLPAEDDVATAVLLERQLDSWQRVLDGLYQGSLTVCRDRAGQLWACARGLLA